MRGVRGDAIDADRPRRDLRRRPGASEAQREQLLRGRDRKTRRAGVGDAVQRLHEQDQDGIDAEFLYPSGAVDRLRMNPDDQIYKAMLQAYNTWIAEA